MKPLYLLGAGVLYWLFAKDSTSPAGDASTAPRNSSGQFYDLNKFRVVKVVKRKDGGSTTVLVVTGTESDPNPIYVNAATGNQTDPNTGVDHEGSGVLPGGQAIN